MKIIEPYYEILTPISDGGINELKFIEKVGRTCYKSENNITDDSAKKFVANLIANNHPAIIEHSFLSVKFVVDRGVSHEIVRHRLASYAQESTRYCNYVLDKFDNEITYIKPLFDENKSEDRWAYQLWKEQAKQAEKCYFELIKNGATPQEARAVLPNSLKTELVMTTNYTEWRHFFKLRTAKNAHPQMRQIMIPLLKELQNKIPIIFDDIKIEE